MGQQNQQRRAAKRRARQRQHNAQPTPGPRGPAGFETGAFDAGWFNSGRPTFTVSAVHALAEWTQNLADGVPGTGAREAFGGFPVGEQRAAVDTAFDTMIRHLIVGGWGPLDLAELARRRSDEPGAAQVLGVVAAQTAQHPRARVHPRWLSQLDQLGAAPGRRPAGWATDAGWPELAQRFGALLAVLSTLPKIHPVLPPPGSSSNASAHVSGAVDANVLRRVRGLLAKAESTEFDEEAEALSAKAQSLMRQHSIDQAMAEVGGVKQSDTSARRLWLDNPYVPAKAMLAHQVATANRCRCVFSEALGFVTVLGFATDLDTVELLTTSLLMQASRAMRAAGSHTTRNGTSRTRSFRQSFLIAYADRIGERLLDSSEAAEQATDVRSGGTLLPVLVARERVVQDAFDAAFPNLVERGVRISNAAGWGAGRAAADLAQLDVRRAVT